MIFLRNPSSRLLAFMQRMRVEVVAFLSWWILELREMGATLLVRVAPKLARPVVVRFQGAEAWMTAGADPQPLEAIETVQGSRAVLVLEDRHVLRHELILPAAIERELEHAMELHMERELPVARDDVCVDWKVTRRDRQQQRIVVRLLVARREHVAYARDRVSACGLRPVRVGVIGPSGEIDGNLLSQRVRPDRLRFTPLDWRLAMLSSALALGTAAVIGGQWFYERLEVSREAERVTATAATAESLTAKLLAGSASGVALIRLMDKPDAIDALTQLTASAPQDTWAYELNVVPGPNSTLQIKLAGFTPTATMFADMLEKTPELDQVRLVSASSAGLGSGRDRLQLSARWHAK
jgi:hypothetical protein